MEIWVLGFSAHGRRDTEVTPGDGKQHIFVDVSYRFVCVMSKDITDDKKYRRLAASDVIFVFCLILITYSVFSVVMLYKERKPRSIASIGMTERRSNAAFSVDAYTYVIGVRCRQMCGVHYRFDSQEGLLLGETVAVRLLQQASTRTRDIYIYMRYRRFITRRSPTTSWARTHSPPAHSPTIMTCTAVRYLVTARMSR